MPFVDLSEFLTENDLTITMGEHEYTVPAPDAETGLKYSALSNIAVKASKGQEVSEDELRALRLDDAEEREFVVQILTQEVVDQMRKDGLPWPALTRTAQYAFTHFAVSPDAAAKAMAAGAFSGKAQAPTNRATRRSAAKSARPASTASKNLPKTQG